MEKINAGERGYMITSRADQLDIQQTISINGNWLIPKIILKFMPLKF